LKKELVQSGMQFLKLHQMVLLI